VEVGTQLIEFQVNCSGTAKKERDDVYSPFVVVLVGSLSIAYV
jgi:hypothetical protein